MVYKLKCNIFKTITEAKKRNSENLKDKNDKIQQYTYAIEFINEILIICLKKIKPVVLHIVKLPVLKDYIIL